MHSIGKGDDLFSRIDDHAPEKTRLQLFFDGTNIFKCRIGDARCKFDFDADSFPLPIFQNNEIAPVNRTVLDEALGLDFSDFEDAVVHQSAICFNTKNRRYIHRGGAEDAENMIVKMNNNLKNI
jgi:hypothetical protein